MSPPRTLIFDAEAVDALALVDHPKRRRVLAAVAAASARTSRRAGSVRLLVPTAVRVEAGWDRSAAGSAFVNRLRIADHSLDGETANVSARERIALRLSVPDAHLAATLIVCEKPAAVLTSDVDDLRRVASRVNGEITVIRI